jgi:hypothetical protein
MTDAQLCTVVSKRGTRVYVGRPTTLSAEELAGLGNRDASAVDAVEARRLTKTITGYAITAEFESKGAADKARGSFEELVDIIEELVTNELEPESRPKPDGA